MSSETTCFVPPFYQGNPNKSVIGSTTPDVLASMSDKVRQLCYIGGDARKCHDAVATYSSHNQASMSNVYSGSKPSPSITTHVKFSTAPTVPIDHHRYQNLVDISNMQSVVRDSNGEFDMWSFNSSCNPCSNPIQ